VRRRMVLETVEESPAGRARSIEVRRYVKMLVGDNRHVYVFVGLGRAVARKEKFHWALCCPERQSAART